MKKKMSDKIYVVKVGNNERPAGPADLDSMAQALNLAMKNKASFIVSHHAVEFITIDRNLLCNGEVIVCDGKKK